PVLFEIAAFTLVIGLFSLSLRDALPILVEGAELGALGADVALTPDVVVVGADIHYLVALHGEADTAHALAQGADTAVDTGGGGLDRKSTRLNSSHVKISYAVFCLKKKTY